MNFSRIYFDLSGILTDLMLLKKGIRVDISRGTRGADVAHSGHVAGPREATWMLVWRQRDTRGLLASE